MKGWVLYGLNNLQLEELAAAKPQRGEILVKVKAAGICSSDIQRVYVKGAYHYPIILGHEFAGETENGRRVSVFPLIPCFKCESCQARHYETCSNYNYIGSRRDGAFAEYVAVPEWNLLEIPAHVTFAQAALFEPAAVALHAVKRLNPGKGSRVAIIGKGAIGQLAAQWLANFGVTEIDLLGRNDLPNFEQYDACLEASGAREGLRRSIELTKPNGRLVLVGNPDVDFNIDQKLYGQILRKQITLQGSWNSSYPADWREVRDRAGKLRLDSFISHRYKFRELDKALAMMRGKKESYRKVIMDSGK
ncbi:MAG: galactitol-1-phosphate 5-dehydrogenase [Desulfarculales bacterium]|jgi:L-iditol 2-dehydrogenase|nr:galactitol-1-phosphate 5-dehydrogenase [Desulfarculales bacterium]